MKYISFFDALSGVKIKDCFFDNYGKVIFIVKENDIAKAIGRRGSNIKRFEEIFKKKAKVVEFSNNIEQFIRNYVAPIKVGEINVSSSVVTIHALDTKTRALVIGREGKNLENLTNILKRYFPIKEVKIK